jgi:hypothetical protein
MEGTVQFFWGILTTEYTEGMWHAETRKARSGGGDLGTRGRGDWEKEKVAVPVLVFYVCVFYKHPGISIDLQS